MQSNSQNDLTSKELHRKFVILGNNRRRLTNELLALLPEIYEKKIYKKYSATIIEYAGKFGGLSKGVVMKRLRLEKHLKDKPILREAIKTEGVHKVALIAKLATPETENIWVDKLKNMSKSSLFELAKEVRGKVEDGKCSGSNAGFDFGFCKAAPQKMKIEIGGELLFMFLKLKKKYGNNLSNNEVMKKILETAVDVSEAKFQTEPTRIQSMPHKASVATRAKLRPNATPQSSLQKVQIFPGKIFSRYEKAVQENITTQATRYIKVRIKKPALSSTNGKCSYPGCEKPAENLHHPDRFARGQNHDNIKPLCKTHHEFMHNGLVKNEQDSVDSWQLNLDGKLDEIDDLYRNYRRAAV
ncbi:hypothetical protein A3B60_00475 [Candidatus Peregrinibacteria bacterium RIFCSPLOWO2_01_FULL_39_12]|nr:MAG: hypothetical protein A3B60_00475 [Candidatus Peregrinibacteria bacterium RIFCSPLOWO2_01_FULL_39_12]OGJ42216.1 MAG: hypothetical protein A3I58_01225 [Candidatus Peregrinibacteria bacterium RIFCSPLOWO2_02_FULL_39_10]